MWGAMLRIGLLLGVCLVTSSSCYAYDPLYCQQNSDCADVAPRTWCDRNGDVEGIANTCIVEPPKPPTGTVTLTVPSDPVYLEIKGSISVPVEVTRDGVDGTVDVTVDNLPVGVSYRPLAIARGASTGSLVLEASERAHFDVFDLDVRADLAGVSTQKRLSIEVVGVPGTPDTSFGADGSGTAVIDTRDPGDVADEPLAIFGQEDKVILVTRGLTMIRLLRDGTPDEAFGTHGRSKIDLSTVGLVYVRGQAATVDSRGRIIVVGVGRDAKRHGRIFYARLTTDGITDPTLPPFVGSISGAVATIEDENFTSVTALPDGTCVLTEYLHRSSTGHYTPEVGRLNRDWSIDPEFGPDIRLVHTLRAQAPVVGPGNTVIFADTSGSILKLTSSGDLDENFGDGGYAALPTPTQSIATPQIRTHDGKVIIAGSEGSPAGDRTVVWRLDDTGHLDSHFGDGGRVGLPAPAMPYDSDRMSRIWETPDGLLYGMTIVNYQFRFGAGSVKMFRIDGNGALDRSFGTDGVSYDLEGWDIVGSLVVDRHRFMVFGFRPASKGIDTLIRQFWY